MKDITKNNPKNVKKPVILVAPLDWGLGHATRCIPIIKGLLIIDYEVIIAAEGAQATLLMQEFPSLRCVYLRGYKLEYARSGWKTLFKLLAQVPKILTAINQEHRWLLRFLSQNKIDAVISDNRYGLYSSHIPCAILTHQLTIKSAWRNTGETLLRKIHYRMLNKFTRCWVPDYPGPVNLGGVLSHPPTLPSIPVIYTGPLTRFEHALSAMHYKLLIILSGPEPQRTILENILLKELENYQEPVAIVRGLPDVMENPEAFNNISFFNHLPAREMNALVNASETVISRPGYSTVMDMMTLGKRCIFIPTPGQTEQIYLAGYLASGKHCLFYHQPGFSLHRALRDLETTQLVPFVTLGQAVTYETLFKDLLR